MDTRANPNGGLVEPRGGRPRRWVIPFGVVVGFAAAAVRDLIAVAPREPGWLRWLRVLADHPIRAGIAASLVVLALSPSRADDAEPDEPPSS